MTAIIEQLTVDIKAAMRARDQATLTTLRTIHAAIKQHEVDTRQPPDEDAVTAILRKLRKQHQESIVYYQQAGREDALAKEQHAVSLVERYLPTPLDAQALDAAIRAAIADVGATGARDMGKVMGVLQQRVNGRADMRDVSVRVKALLTADG